jgi:O-methyltransferase
LDTDWYQSTLHELVHLHPRLAKGGIPIIDDYGPFAGAKKAVDEYFQEYKHPHLFERID